MLHLSWKEIHDRAQQFVRDHSGDRSEAAAKQTFWNDFFQVFGLRRASLASFEENARNVKGNRAFIDLLWKGKLLVEHKSLGEDLDRAKSQAFDYLGDLTRANRWDEVPRFVLVSDFARFVLYDLEPDEETDLPLFEGRKIEEHRFTLAEFPKNVRVFAFMLGQTRVRLHPEDPANEKAYGRMCELHDALKAGGFAGHDLERLLVRVLFCLFAEDTALFGPDVFTRFIRLQTREDGSDVGAKLNELFDWLNRPEAEALADDHDPFHGFRYVNGGLFQERLGFPRFNRAMRDALLDCCDFQWSKISPAVFGSLFQGVLEDRARRQQGAHYTSERDIMKVLRSLFLDELRGEWERRKADRSSRRRTEMAAFHDRLRALRFLDPACGCGNFLVLAYRELRTLEIEVMRALHGTEQQVLDVRRVLKVDVDQFYGIEYSEWPVRIAEVALWLMDHQMNQQAAAAFGRSFDRLPLKTSPHIVQGNALRLNWDEVLPRGKCSFVLGNPPFVGKHLLNAEQEEDMALVWGETKGAGNLDYVTSWYRKAVAYVGDTRIPVAFVSTNSITQGEQVGYLWNELFQRWQIKIHFAHRTFAWSSEARGKAQVHVVIIGFGAFDVTRKLIHEYDVSTDLPSTVAEVTNISPYLIQGGDFALPSRQDPLNDVPPCIYGSKPVDGGHLIIEETEREAFVSDNPGAETLLRPLLCNSEYLYGIPRWCLWLVDVSPGLFRHLPDVMNRLEAVRKFRLASKKLPTRQKAGSPTLFAEIRQPTSEFIVMPLHTSSERHYIPWGYFSPKYIIHNSCSAIANANSYHFGIISSRMHMAWVGVVCGRIKSDFRYSTNIVYNNFPWPGSTPAQRQKVKEKAQAVLAAREPHLPPHGPSTLADLYDPLTMPPALAKAHAELDRAVERCYRAEPFHTDRERVEHLFRLYEQLTAPLLPATPGAPGRRRTAGKTGSPGLPRRRRGSGLLDLEEARDAAAGEV